MKCELKVEAVENGFIVKTFNDNRHYKSYAFETAEAMSEMVAKWGHGATQVSIDKPINGKG